MLAHVRRVAGLARAHGFQPMMWSDMYFRCASPTGDYYGEELSIPPQIVQAAPRGCGACLLGLLPRQRGLYDRYIRLHQQFAAPLRFAGGLWTWLGPAVDYDVFFKTRRPLCAPAKKTACPACCSPSGATTAAKPAWRPRCWGFRPMPNFVTPPGWTPSKSFAALRPAPGRRPRAAAHQRF